MFYEDLVKIYEKLEGNSKRLEKTYILSELFKNVKNEEIVEIVCLSRGRVFPDYDEREIGISSQLAIKAISSSSGISAEEIEKKWKNLGDLGKVAENFISKKRQSTLFSNKLTTKKVFENLRKAAEISGQGTVEKKIALIAELLTSASPLEAKYIVRTVLEELRIGVGDGVMRDAIVWASFQKEIGLSYNKEEKMIEIANKTEYPAYTSLVQEAYDLANDFSEVMVAAKNGVDCLKEIKLKPGYPIKVMLALKSSDVNQAFETVGRPAQFEFKYDGFRLMINKDEKGRIKLFTRRLDNVTNQFPEVVEYAQKYISGDSFIIDSEAVGYDPKRLRYRPFQEISQRIKRKYDIEKLQNELPVEVNIFDIVYYEGKNLIKMPFKKRSELLERIVKSEKWKIKLAEKIITDNEKEAQKFYEMAMSEGEEGIMAKNLQAPYKPGARVGYMLKIKPDVNAFDLVIVGAEYGTGKRSGWLSSFILACKDENNFLEIGKVGTGIKEKADEGLSFIELTNMLKPLITEEHARTVKVKPEIVVEVTYQEIQKSPSYSSGYALRFPRVTKLRPDRSVGDIASLKEIEIEHETRGGKKKETKPTKSI
ncbi:MAG: ATP-dependent DNA ligase [archaeon]